VNRGEVITVASGGDYGKPRPAVVIQTDRLTVTDTVLVCLMSSTIIEAPLHRLTLAAGKETGLRVKSQIMADKIMAIRKSRCGPPIGRIDSITLSALGKLLAFVTGVEN
jgi:mRNA interferase MazF